MEVSSHRRQFVSFAPPPCDIKHLHMALRGSRDAQRTARIGVNCLVHPPCRIDERAEHAHRAPGGCRAAHDLHLLEKLSDIGPRQVSHRSSTEPDQLVIEDVSIASFRGRPKRSFGQVNFQSLPKCYAGFIGFRCWVDSGLDLAHELSGSPSGLAQANAVNSIDLDSDGADVPTVPTDIALHRVCLGRLV